MIKSIIKVKIEKIQKILLLKINNYDLLSILKIFNGN